MRYKQSVLELVDNSTEHMTAEQVFFALKKRFPAVVLATVYNNLGALCEQGYIRKISAEGQPDRYDKKTRHDHLICRRCGRLTDVVLTDLTEELERQTGRRVEAYDLKIQHTCPECAKSGAQ